MADNILSIAGIDVPPGRSATIDLPTPGLYTHTQVNIPIKVIRGKKTGPTMLLCAALHGDEINGVEIIRRLLRLKILDRLHGTLIAVPIVNIYGFFNRARYLPDRRDLNRSFPGSHKGSLTSSISALFMEEIVRHCTHGIDIHTGSNHRINLPQIRASLDDEETRKLAEAFGAPVIVDARIRDGSLRQAASEAGVRMLLYEAGQALRFDAPGIRTGLGGILSVMAEIGMIPKKARRRHTPEPLIALSTTWIRASSSGILHTARPLGARVSKGELVASTSDPLGENLSHVHSPVDGVVIGRLNCPLVHRGDALLNVASVDPSVEVNEVLDAIEMTLYGGDTEDQEAPL